MNGGRQKLRMCPGELWRQLKETPEENLEAGWKLMALRSDGNLGDHPITPADCQRERLVRSHDPF